MNNLLRTETRGQLIRKDARKNRIVYLMFVPVLVYYVLFHYLPMYGAIIAFKDFSPGLGIWGSPWVGLKHFEMFFSGVYFERIFTNTIIISFCDLLFGFPAPIILALLLNELRSRRFKKVVQTVSYLPHFISLVVMAGIIRSFTDSSGIITDIYVFFGGRRASLLSRPEFFRAIYILSGIWQNIGWGAIIYIAALAGIDQELYEAARIDGAGKWKQFLHVTFPGILPTIVILLILRVGSVMNVGFEKIILLYNPLTMETADVISTYVYRKGLLDGSYSYSSAVGLFNSLINFTLLLITNWISGRVNETKLW